MAKDRVEAAKAVVQIDLKAAAGMYKKPIAEIAEDVRYEPLPGEVWAVVIAAWQRGGLLPTAVVERIIAKLVPPADQ